MKTKCNPKSNLAERVHWRGFWPIQESTRTMLWLQRVLFEQLPVPLWSKRQAESPSSCSLCAWPFYTVCCPRESTLEREIQFPCTRYWQKLAIWCRFPLIVHCIWLYLSASQTFPFVHVTMFSDGQWLLWNGILFSFAASTFILQRRALTNAAFFLYALAMALAIIIIIVIIIPPVASLIKSMPAMELNHTALQRPPSVICPIYKIRTLQLGSASPEWEGEKLNQRPHS